MGKRATWAGPPSLLPLGVACAAAVLLLAAWVPRAAVASGAAAIPGAPLSPRAIELTPSVMILGNFDWEFYQAVPPFTSRCVDMVGRVAELGGSQVNFVPTHHWIDRKGAGRVDSFCVLDSTMTCYPFTAQLISSFRSGMELCFRRTVELGLAISVVPHLDDGGGTATWRNGLLFDPTTPYGGFSYQQVMLNPLVDALAAALTPALTGAVWSPRPAAPIWLALQGEMSATVLHFPNQYRNLVGEMRQRLLTGLTLRGVTPDRVAAMAKIVQVGVSLNYNKVMALNTGAGPEASGINTAAAGAKPAAAPAAPATTPAASRLRGVLRGLLHAVGAAPEPHAGGGRALLQSTRAAQAGVDVEAVRQLLEEIDFLGISAYASINKDFKEQELQSSAFTFFAEFRDNLGIDVPAILERRAIDLHYSEFGIGGGSSSDGTKPAPTPEAAAKTPFYGVWGAYDRATDPWAPQPMKDFLRSYFRRTLNWLGQGGGPTYFVSHCFLWGMGSWDVLGIYVESTTPAGSFRDPGVAQLVTAHNRAVVAAAAAAGAVEPSK